jgi:hypothetical protein
MLVARLPCGCVAAADFYPEDPTTPANVMEWLNKDGFVVRLEVRESISAEKCWRHWLGQRLVRMKHSFERWTGATG